MNTEPQSSRYSLGLAAEVLASEQSVLRLITRNTPLPELLVEVCRRAEALLGDGASCTILLLDPDGAHVRVGAAPSLPAQYSTAIDGAPIGPAAGSCGTAMYRRRMVAVEDIETDPLWADYRSFALPLGLRACWSVPFEDEAGSVLGAFAVYYRTPRRPSDEETDLLRDIGNSVGLAVHQDRIARQLALSEEQHRLVVNSLSEGILVVSRKGMVVASHPSANRMMRTKGDLVGRRLVGAPVPAARGRGDLVVEDHVLDAGVVGAQVLGVGLHLRARRVGVGHVDGVARAVVARVARAQP